VDIHAEYRSVVEAWPHIPSLAELGAETKKMVEQAAKNAHAAMGWALLILVVLHIAASLRHSLILKDGVMLRMLPRFLRSSRGVALVIASLIGVAVLPQDVRAQEWAVDKGASSITFEVNAGGQIINGTFKDYQIEIHMDPDEPKEAEISAAIDLNSVSTGQGVADQTLTTAEWFDTSNTPVAELKAKSVKFVNDGQFEMRADFKIKGTVKRILVPFTLEVRKGEATARAEFVINRLDFKVGPTGPVSGTVIDNNVKIVVALAAKRLDN
jgi:polyisoprenoid-binding protein YceI